MELNVTFNLLCEGTKSGFVGNIDSLTTENKFFRKVLYTAKHSQLVVMSLNPGEDIGEEVHPGTDQFFRVEAGSGEVKLNGTFSKIKAGSAVVVPAGTKHNVVNTGKTPLKLYTIYSPPHHKDGTIHRTKADALKES